MCSDFSNVISKQDVKTLAEADDQEVVREVQVHVLIFMAFLCLLYILPACGREY